MRTLMDETLIIFASLNISVMRVLIIIRLNGNGMMPKKKTNGNDRKKTKGKLLIRIRGQDSNEIYLLGKSFLSRIEKGCPNP